MTEFVMPALGADMEAGTLVEWRRHVGDSVERGDIIAEVETDKGVIEVEAYQSGIIEEHLVAPGTKVPVGTPLARIREQDKPKVGGAVKLEPTRASPSVRRLAHELGVELEEAAPQGVVTREDVRRAAQAPGASPRPSQRSGRVRISPVARKRAESLGIDAHALTGSGERGAILLADVERAAKQAGPAKGAPTSPGTAARSRMRAAIAASMSRSKREIPHYYLVHSIDLKAAFGWLEEVNQSRGVHERLLPAALFVKAVALALRQVPELNARWHADAAPAHPDIHVGVAVSLRGGGLVAPAIAHTDRLELPALMHALEDVVARARSGKLRSFEISEGTITVTSLGERGVETLHPVIFPPQVAIVGFGRVLDRPWAHQGKLEVRPVVQATLAADHRVSDGHRGAKFLNRLEQLLQQPESL